MTIEEMMRLLRTHIRSCINGKGFSEEELEMLQRLPDLLRAGRAMRDSDDETSLIAAIVAWDAALGEKE